MKALLTLVSSCIIVINSLNATPSRDLLVGRLKGENLEKVIVPSNKVRIIPSYTDRNSWVSIPDTLKMNILAEGEKALKCTWPTIKATDFLAFKLTGDRSAMETPYNERKENLRALVFAELVEGKDRFIPQIVNGVWAICEQSSWVLSAHLPNQKKWTGLPDDQDIFIDLGAGEVGALLSWTYTLFHDEFDMVSPLINRKIKDVVNERILIPYYSREDMWWMGFNPRSLVNNWNIWINYNALQCIWLMEEDPVKRAAGILKTMRSVDKFINVYPADGGCDEGPSYWSHAGAKLYEYLDFIKQISNGKIDLFDEEIVKNIATYITRISIAYPYVVNFGDGSAKLSLSPSLVYRFGKAVNDVPMVEYGTFLTKQHSSNYFSSIVSSVKDIYEYDLIRNGRGKEPFLDHFWFPDLQMGGARDLAGSKNGFFFAAMGAHNGQSHNHNDVGSFVLYYDGKPLLVDAGVGTYTRQTFSNERYKIWTMQSSYHNLPDINGCAQVDGRKYAATNVVYNNSRMSTTLSMDIASAYSDTCGVKSWNRSYTLNKGKNFIIGDDFKLKASKSPSILNFITPAKVEKGKGVLILKSEGETFFMTFNPSIIQDVTIESVSFSDPRLTKVWTKGLNRIRLVFKGSLKEAKSAIIVKRAL